MLHEQFPMKNTIGMHCQHRLVKNRNQKQNKKEYLYLAGYSSACPGILLPDELLSSLLICLIAMRLTIVKTLEIYSVCEIRTIFPAVSCNKLCLASYPATTTDTEDSSLYCSNVSVKGLFYNFGTWHMLIHTPVYCEVPLGCLGQTQSCSVSTCSNDSGSHHFY